MKNKNSFLLIIAGLFLLISISVYLYKTKSSSFQLRSIGSSKNIDIILHAIGENSEFYFTTWIEVLPKEKKIGLIFVNPLSKFPSEDETLIELNSKAIHVIEKEFPKIIGKKPNFIIRIDSNEFKKIIDIAGGLPVFIEPNINPPSNQYNRKINLAYKMDGRDALDYLVSIQNNEPLSFVKRLERQESALLSFYHNVKNFHKDIKKGWLNIIYDRLKTNIKLNEFIHLTELVLEENFEFGILELPGEIQLNKEKNLFFLNINMDTARVAYKNFHAELISEFYGDPERARVEVLNGTSITGLAKKGKSLLNENRIKVLTVDNAWDSNFNQTFILDRSGNTLISKKVLKSLSIPSEIYFCIRKDLGLDTTLILGEDFGKSN